MSSFFITCGYCGHTDDFDNFCRTPINGKLPKNTFQCPRCKRAFHREIGPAKVLSSGFVVPGDVKIVGVQGYL